MSGYGQAEAKRIGICFVDDEMFWWRADEGEACPMCSTDDEHYDETHRFFVAEARAGGDGWPEGGLPHGEHPYDYSGAGGDG